MVAQNLIKELVKIVGRDNVLFSKKDLIAYSYDATQHQEMPDVIVFPNSTAEVSQVMKLAYREKVPVIPRGAGTGISGGTVPIKGGIVLELSLMNKVIALDTANRRAIVEPGVVNLDLQDILSPLGYMYPPDPASQKSCTLGGNIGENAGGPLCFKYGVTSKYVCGIETVMPDGSVVEFGGSVEDIPGYDLRGLFIGSEGTFGIATRLVLHILPLPEAAKTMLAIFDTLEDAGQSVSDIISAGIVPSTLELMDRNMCGAIEQSLKAGYPTDANGVLLIEVSGVLEGLDRQVDAISAICKKNKVREFRLAKTNAEKDALWKGRKGAFGSVARICPPYLVNDGTVPRNKLVPALLKIQEISGKHKVQIANVAHAGDGNLHPLILFDRNNPEEIQAARKTGEEILDTCLNLGGTISGEHGIGLEKLKAMDRMFSPADLAFMHKIKKVFDPEDVLNPGKLLPPETKGLPATEEPTTENLNKRLAEIVGTDNLLKGEEVPARVDGLTPGAVVFPQTTEQVAQIVKAANKFHKTLVPWGSGSKQSSGPVLTSADIILSLKKLNQIYDFDQGNSTIRVGAGIVNGELQKEIAKYGLFFPLDPLSASTSTIGGELATADAGPRRLMYGNARDLVLGMTVVAPDGEIIRPGGKTMKNVAGIDLVKLFVGSGGTLGVITEAILRLFPIPEMEKTVCLSFSDVNNVFSLVNKILTSVLTPGAIELVDSVAGRYMKTGLSIRDDEISLMVQVEGSREIVERHLKEITNLAKAEGPSSLDILEGDREKSVWEAYRGIYGSFFSKYPAGFKCKAAVPLVRSKEMFTAIKETGHKHKSDIGIQAHAGNGILSLCLPSGMEDPAGVIHEVYEAISKLGGLFVLETAPLEFRKNNFIKYDSSSLNLMRQMKAALDPNNILNPGKVVGGQH